MTYFKVLDLTSNEAFYVSSPLRNETPFHMAMSLHLNLERRYKIEEVTADEFFRETDEDDFLGSELVSVVANSDCEDDWDWEDRDDDCYNYNN